jgi:hypothetical protein
VDTDGRTLVLEFPADQEFAMQMAEEPDMRELLQRALGVAMGFAPPVRFTLSRALSRGQAPEDDGLGAATKPPKGLVNDPPSVVDGAPEYFEAIAAPHPWVADAAPEPGSAESAAAEADSPSPGSEGGSTGSLTRQLMESLGAEIVAERPAESDGNDAAGDTAAESDLLELESSDFGLKDPELFDSDDGEDDS